MGPSACRPPAGRRPAFEDATRQAAFPTAGGKAKHSAAGTPQALQNPTARGERLAGRDIRAGERSRTGRHRRAIACRGQRTAAVPPVPPPLRESLQDLNRIRHDGEPWVLAPVGLQRAADGASRLRLGRWLSPTAGGRRSSRPPAHRKHSRTRPPVANGRLDETSARANAAEQADTDEESHVAVSRLLLFHRFRRRSAKAFRIGSYAAPPFLRCWAVSADSAGHRQGARGSGLVGVLGETAAPDFEGTVCERGGVVDDAGIAVVEEHR
ncbi:hypothetical protein SAMN05216489_01083 [Streptomyces sp. 3213]|nr:hypothetical protein SAMN05216489_01083 [Streptomyces sp. 3213] [Streptomyces sp. 3213.3]